MITSSGRQPRRRPSGPARADVEDGSVEPLRTEDMAWVPTGPGKSFRPLRFDADGWSELMRLEPGSVVERHRHTGEVHAFTLAGARQVRGSDEVIGAGDYLYEPAGNVDTWYAVGDDPCIVHIKVGGAVEFLDPDGRVQGRADSTSQSAIYRQWCHQHQRPPAPGVFAATMTDLTGDRVDAPGEHAPLPVPARTGSRS